MRAGDAMPSVAQAWNQSLTLVNSVSLGVNARCARGYLQVTPCVRIGTRHREPGLCRTVPIKFHTMSKCRSMGRGDIHEPGGCFREWAFGWVRARGLLVTRGPHDSQN